MISSLLAQSPKWNQPFYLLWRWPAIVWWISQPKIIQNNKFFISVSLPLFAFLLVGNIQIFHHQRRLMVLCEKRELLFLERTQKSSQQQHGKCKKGRATHVMGAESPSSVRRRGLRLMLIWRMGINFLFLPRLFSCAARDSLPLDPCWERKFTSYTHSSVVSLWMIMLVRWMNRMWREKGIENENAVKELNKHCVLTWSTLSALSKAHIKGMPWKVTVCIRWIIKTICQTRVLPTTELVLNADYSHCERERERIACNCCTE